MLQFINFVSPVSEEEIVPLRIFWLYYFPTLVMGLLLCSVELKPFNPANRVFTLTILFLTYATC